ncbi:MAG: hypothetical protein IIW73_05505 [Clostridia bacterium]|nr:hypothetical protein [Clostridia bacterium]
MMVKVGTAKKLYARKGDRTIMCNNGLFGGGCCTWIIILILIFACSGNGFGTNTTSGCGCGCGCNNDCC